MQTLQNKVVKVLFVLDYGTPTDTVYQITRILQIQSILEIEQCKHVYKITNNQLKCNIPLISNNQIHSLETRNHHHIYLTITRTNVALNNPLARCIETFNALPARIKNKDNYSSFLKGLKRYKNIFQTYKYYN